VFTHLAVGSYVNRGFVALEVDAERGEGPTIVEQYRVQAYPTVLVLDARGLERGRVVDFLPPAEFIEALQAIVEGEDVLSALVDAVEHDPDDFQARYRLAHALALAARREEAELHYDAILVADPKDELGLASKVMFDRAVLFRQKLDGDPPGAIEALEELQRRHPGSPSALQAHRAIGRVLHQLGRTDEAIARLDAMLATDPGDVALSRSYGWFSFRERCRPDRGLAVVEAALEATPEDAQLHYLRAELLHLLDRDSEAVEAIRRARAAEPDSAFYKRQVRRFEALAGA
jgi:tetratricopeptide (TPR) repeat protein